MTTPDKNENVRLDGFFRRGRPTVCRNQTRQRLRHEQLEDRRLLTAAAYDLIGLTALRDDPLFADLDGSGVSVAVIDTGLDRTHPLLAPNYVGGADIAKGGDDPIPIEGGTGGGAHGTHVAGTIGATDPDIGVATGVGLIGLQVFKSVPGSRAVVEGPELEAALQWVLAHRQQHNIVAVNMSLQGGFYESPTEVASNIYADEIRANVDFLVPISSGRGTWKRQL